MKQLKHIYIYTYMHTHIHTGGEVISSVFEGGTTSFDPSCDNILAVPLRVDAASAVLGMIQVRSCDRFVIIGVCDKFMTISRGESFFIVSSTPVFAWYIRTCRYCVLKSPHCMYKAFVHVGIVCLNHLICRYNNMWKASVRCM